MAGQLTSMFGLQLMATMAVGAPAAASAGLTTGALDTIVFYDDGTSMLTSVASGGTGENGYGMRKLALSSLNAALWASSNTSKAEVPFNQQAIQAGAPVGLEAVLNFSAAESCTSGYKNLSFVPTSPSAQLNLAEALEVTYEECVSFCCSTARCAAWVWHSGVYSTENLGSCQTFASGYVTSGTPSNPQMVGGAISGAPAEVDEIANGLRSAMFLGGVGTGGYEMRADGTFHLSNIRGQSPAAEPWEGTVRDYVLAVSVNGKPYVVRIKPFGNISAVPQLVYQDRFPIAKMKFLNFSLYAYSAVSPGDTNLSNTPAVMYSLHVENSGKSPMAVSFMIVKALGLRNDFAQYATGTGTIANATTPSACASQCSLSSTCLAWQLGAFVSASHGYNTSNVQQLPNYTNLGNADFTSPPTLRNGFESPPLQSIEACEALCSANPKCTCGLYLNGTVRHGECWLTQYAAKTPRHDFCGAKPGQVCESFIKNGVGPSPSETHCELFSGPFRNGANLAGIDSGVNGTFQVINNTVKAVTFTTTVPSSVTPFNGIGSEALFIPENSLGVGSTSSVGSGSSIDELLAMLNTPDPVQGLNDHQVASGALYGAAVASVTVQPGESASLTISHAWYYPHYYWYRDTQGGPDNGQRYATTYASILDVMTAINVTSISEKLAKWQQIYAGLPPLLQDGFFNLWNHVRSSVWTQAGQYRQWESLEFVDWSNPTNGDERHLNYFHVLPETMRSKLIAEANNAQNKDGMFYCIVVSKGGADEWGSDPCSSTGQPIHPDDITMVMVGTYEFFVMGNDTALVDIMYPHLQLALTYYVKMYNSTSWHLPFHVHETYDAVKESSSIQGEGNNGYSLYNALNYLTGLHCMRAFATYKGDAASVSLTNELIVIVQASIQDHFWQEDKGHYFGDTIDEKPIVDANGETFISNDDLHGQVLGYRLGFGDLLPIENMKRHQAFILSELMTAYGLKYDRYSAQNWLMGDNSYTALQLRWNLGSVDAWDTTLFQMNYFRNVKKEASKHTAVIDTDNGLYGLLNYYGYALFAYHTLSAFAGQTVDLPARNLAFVPHPSAFDNGSASIPILLAGALGTVSISSSKAVLSMQFMGELPPMSFLKISICNNTFAATDANPFILDQENPLTFALTPLDC